jgi:hypothetical protein
MVDDDAVTGARGCPCRPGAPRPRTARVDEALALLGAIDPAGPLAP